MDKLPSIFLNEYFKRKPMRLHEREDDGLFLMEKTEECNLEYIPKSELESLEAKLQELVESNKNHKHHHDEAIIWWNKAEAKLQVAVEALEIYDDTNPDGLWWEGVNKPGVIQDAPKYAREALEKIKAK